MFLINEISHDKLQKFVDMDFANRTLLDGG